MNKSSSEESTTDEQLPGIIFNTPPDEERRQIEAKFKTDRLESEKWSLMNAEKVVACIQNTPPTEEAYKYKKEREDETKRLLLNQRYVKVKHSPIDHHEASVKIPDQEELPLSMPSNKTSQDSSQKQNMSKETVKNSTSENKEHAIAPKSASTELPKATVASTAPVFQFGSQSSSMSLSFQAFDKTSSSGFSFGVKADATKLLPKSSESPAPENKPTQPMFGNPTPVFGKTTETTKAFTFASNTASTAAPVFQFGSTGDIEKIDSPKAEAIEVQVTKAIRGEADQEVIEEEMVPDAADEPCCLWCFCVRK